jgi:thiol-disulfide isomerase/thioredoxin
MPVDEMQNANTSGLSFGRNASGVLNTDVVFTERQKYEFSNATTQDGRLIVYYFYSSACPASKALRPEIDRLEGMYDTVEWLEYDIVPQGGMWAYQDFAAQYNLSREQRLVPQVLVNGTIITDRFNINKSLEEVLASFKVS